MQGRNWFVRTLRSLQKARTKIKTRMGNSTGNADKKSTKTGQNHKAKERSWNMERQKGNGNTRNITI